MIALTALVTVVAMGFVIPMVAIALDLRKPIRRRY